MPPEETEVYEDYKVQEDALDIINDLEDEIMKLFLLYAGDFAKENKVELIDPEQMKVILNKVLNKVIHDGRFTRE